MILIALGHIDSIPAAGWLKCFGEAFIASRRCSVVEYANNKINLLRETGGTISINVKVLHRESPFSHSRSFLISKTWNTAIFPYFPLKITYFPLFFTLFPQKFLDMQAKAHFFALTKANFEATLAKEKMILSFF